MKIIVIGGGPSGMMAAITAAINHEVILLEKNDRLAIKLLMSGNGRCNITNNKPIDEFINNCSKSTRFMYSALSEFSILDLINFFEKNGCKLMEEDNNRMFPVSNKAKSILEVFEKQLIKNNVKIKFNTEVKDIEINNDLITVKTNDEDYKCDHLICTCGGLSYPNTGSNGFGYKLAKKLGHTIVPLIGVEVPLVSNEKVIQEKTLMGLSLNNVKINLLIDNKVKEKIQSDIMFTHFGLSGPAILYLSEKAAIALKQNKKVDIMITTSDNINLDKKTIGQSIKGIAPKRWLDYLIEDQDRIVDQTSKKEITEINEKLKGYVLNITDTLPIEKAIVTSGGIKTSEIDQKSMKSKLQNNISFCGEVLDIHGPIGGYNLTLAIISGYCAGKNI